MRLQFSLLQECIKYRAVFLLMILMWYTKDLNFSCAITLGGMSFYMFPAEAQNPTIRNQNVSPLSVINYEAEKFPSQG